MKQDHVKMWEDCLSIFKDNLSPEQFDSWFSPIVPTGFDGKTLTLFVPSPYFVEHLEGMYLELLGNAIHKVFGKGTALIYNYNQIGNEPETVVKIASSNQSHAAAPKRGATANPFQQAEIHEIDAQLNPRYTFENYCGSSSNKLARSIAEAIANNPNIKTYNPLFIFGAPGVGKTHLIQAVGIRIKEHNPTAKVLYITSRLFESQYTKAQIAGSINDFIQFYQGIDTLIIDDIQDLIGKPKTQNAFYHIFDHLLRNQKQLILASDCCPSMMEGMEQRLLSRFKCGMTAELDKPDFELRKHVLCQKAAQDGLDIPQDVLDYIASNITDSIRELEGIVVSLTAHSMVLNQEISIELARKVLANSVKINKKQINFETITQRVAEYYGIDPEQIFTKSKKREISDARQMVMYMAKKHAKMPYTAIGTRLSRTHATVLYACRTIEERLAIEKKLKSDVTKIESKIIG